MRTANPALGADTFIGMRGMAVGQAMSIQGTVNKTAVLLALLLVSSAWTWGQVFAGAPMQGFIGLGALAGFAVAIVTVFKKAWAPITAPLYAALEGLALGGISAMFEASYPGIAIQAVTLTFGVLAALLIAHVVYLAPDSGHAELPPGRRGGHRRDHAGVSGQLRPRIFRRPDAVPP